MTYIVFDTQEQLDNANERWLNAREIAGVYDCICGEPVTIGVTKRWSNGRETIDGRIACLVPTRWADEFKGNDGVELIIEDFGGLVQPLEEIY